jgi:hypothetical protein
MAPTGSLAKRSAHGEPKKLNAVFVKPEGKPCWFTSVFSGGPEGL